MCDLGTSTMRQSRSSLGCCSREENKRRLYPVWNRYPGGRRTDH